MPTFEINESQIEKMVYSLCLPNSYLSSKEMKTQKWSRPTTLSPGQRTQKDTLLLVKLSSRSLLERPLLKKRLFRLIFHLPQDLKVELSLPSFPMILPDLELPWPYRKNICLLDVLPLLLADNFPVTFFKKDNSKTLVGPAHGSTLGLVISYSFFTLETI